MQNLPCPKCDQLAVAVRVHQSKYHIIKLIGWDCRHCGFQEPINETEVMNWKREIKKGVASWEGQL